MLVISQSGKIEDVQRAVRFIRTNAKKYGVRPDRLGVLGSSSGGHLTLSIATRGGPGKADAADPIERESSAVQAAACFFPPTDFLYYGGPGISRVGEGPLAPLQVAFGPQALTPEGRAKLGREISPIYFVTRELFHALGGFDDIPLMEDVAFVRRLVRAGPVIELPLPLVTSARRWRAAADPGVATPDARLPAPGRASSRAS